MSAQLIPFPNTSEFHRTPQNSELPPDLQLQHLEQQMQACRSSTALIQQRECYLDLLLQLIGLQPAEQRLAWIQHGLRALSRQTPVQQDRGDNLNDSLESALFQLTFLWSQLLRDRTASRQLCLTVVRDQA